MDDKTRQLNAAAARADIVGEDPNKEAESRDKQAQRFAVAQMIGMLLQKGFAPSVLIEMMISGAAWVGDNYGVSREQMCKALAEVRMSGDRSLIWTPGT